MTICLDGRVAIVTGAGPGLGRSHALALARHDARLAVNELDGETAGAVAAEIRGAGGKAIGHAAGVTDPQAVEAMVAAATDRWDAVDIPVNNTGILRDRSFARMSLDEFRQVIEVHPMGAVHCCKAGWPGMAARGYGRIVLAPSSTGLHGNFGQTNHGAARMALVGLMQALAIEGRRHDIRVNCHAPHRRDRDDARDIARCRVRPPRCGGDQPGGGGAGGRRRARSRDPAGGRRPISA